MDDVSVRKLEKLWPESTGEPLTLFQSADPESQVGSYVIEPGERVPDTGTTSHDGDEISVVLTGEIELVADGERRTVGPEAVTVIPEGVPHYSENRGSEPVRLVYVVLGSL